MNLDIDEDFPTHPKSVRLCASLQHPVAWAYMIKLWAWARKYQQDGDLSSYTPDEIEFSIGWTQAEGKFYAAAVRAGFIDETPDGKQIHNWMERTGGAIQRMEAGARAAKQRRKDWNEKQAAMAGNRRPGTPAQASASANGTLIIPSMDDDEDARPTVVVARRNGLNQTQPNQTPLSQTQPNQTDQIGVCAETAPPSSTPALLTFQCDGDPGFWELRAERVSEWSGAYPSLDVLGECRKALAWVNAQPSRRKTARGMPAFLVAWFGRSQNRGGGRDGPSGRVETIIAGARDWTPKGTAA